LSNKVGVESQDDIPKRFLNFFVNNAAGEKLSILNRIVLFQFKERHSKWLVLGVGG